MPDLKTVTFDARKYQLVPIDPTVEMIIAIAEADQPPSSRYSNMLAAAPTPAAQSAGQEAVVWQVHPFDYGIGIKGVYARTDRIEQAEAWKRKGWNVEPLYRHAAPVNGGERCVCGQPTTLGTVHRTDGPCYAADAQQAGTTSLPRYTEWMHLRTHGEWSNGVPAWARDFHGHMNDMSAAHAVIAELHAALTSPAKVPDAVMRALDRMSTPLHDSRLSGLTAELDADNVKTIRDYVLSGASPAQVGDINDVVQILRAAWAAAEPKHSITQYPESYIATFADMARAVIAAYGCPAKVGGDEREAFNVEYDKIASRPISIREISWRMWQARAALSADGGEAKVTRSRVLPGEQLMTFPLPEGGKVTLTWPQGISSASIATLSEMLVASALHYMAAEDAVIGPMPEKANQAKGDAS